MTSNTIGRREVIAGAVAATGLTVMGTSARAADLVGEARGSCRALATADAGAWNAAIGTTFTADTGTGPIALKLVSVEPLSRGRHRPTDLARDHGFALSFAAPGGMKVATNRAYRLSSKAYAPMHVFFSSGADKLIAIFN